MVLNLLNSSSLEQLALKGLRCDRVTAMSLVTSFCHNCLCDFVCVDGSLWLTVQVIEDYLINTHAPTHTLYKMKLLNVFEVQRAVEMQNFVDHGNR